MEASVLREIISEKAYAENAKAIRDKHFELFGEKIKTKCPDCLADGAMRIYTELTKNKDVRRYLLHSYTAVFDKKTNKGYNHVTITDEIAERVLKETPALSVRFKKLP